MNDFEFMEKGQWKVEDCIKVYKTRSLGTVKLYDNYNRYAVIYKPATFKVNDKILCKTTDLTKAADVYQQMVKQLEQLQTMLNNIEQDMNYRIVSNLRNNIGVLTQEMGWGYEPESIGNIHNGMFCVVSDVMHAHVQEDDEENE